MYTPTLQTERLILRPLKITDADVVFRNWESDPDVAKYVRWTYHTSVDETIDYINSLQSEIDGDNYDFGLELKETGELIGACGIFLHEETNCYEIGYCLAKKFWGFGFAVEAATEILKFAKNELSQKQVHVCHAIENPASGSVIKKLGGVYIGDGSYTKFDGVTTYSSHEYILNLEEIL